MRAPTCPLCGAPGYQGVYVFECATERCANFVQPDRGGGECILPPPLDAVEDHEDLAAWLGRHGWGPGFP